MSQHICNHTDAKEKLKCYGFPARSINLAGIIVLCLTLVASIIAWFVLGKYGKSETSWTDAATVFIAIGASVLAYQQWRAARTEASLEKFYERLNITNEWMVTAQKSGVATRCEPAGEDATAEERARAEAEAKTKADAIKAAEYDYSMYFFTEVDNLEYVIEKHKLGYISVAHAARGADTFRVRCRHDKFREQLRKYIDRVGYQEDTRRVARLLCKIAEGDEPAAYH